MVEVDEGVDVLLVVGFRQVGESRSMWAGRLGVAVGVGVCWGISPMEGVCKNKGDRGV